MFREGFADGSDLAIGLSCINSFGCFVIKLVYTKSFKM
jgi:hypothetical protein